MTTKLSASHAVHGAAKRGQISPTAASGPMMADAVLRPAWWRARAPRQVRVDHRGVWHFRCAEGRWSTMVPDRIDAGPGYRWLTFAGSRGGGPGQNGRWRVTLWAAATTPLAWRKVRMAALWHMQRASPTHE